MKPSAFLSAILLLSAAGCVYDVRVLPPEITARENDAPSVSVFAVARFEDRHPQKPRIGFTIQHCIMRYMIVFGPIDHAPVVPLERLFSETLAARMKERGYNTRLVSQVVKEGEEGTVQLTPEVDYLVTGTIRAFYFSTPSADFAPAEIRVEWTGRVTDASGREIFRRKIEYTDKKLLGFGTNAFYNVAPFVRKALYASVDRFLESPELKGILWRRPGSGP